MLYYYYLLYEYDLCSWCVNGKIGMIVLLMMFLFRIEMEECMGQKTWSVIASGDDYSDRGFL